MATAIVGTKSTEAFTDTGTGIAGATNTSNSNSNSNSDGIFRGEGESPQQTPMPSTTASEKEPPVETTTLMEITSMNSFDSTALNDSLIESDIHRATITVAAPDGVDRRNPTAISSVTAERKEQLLLQARYDRVQWIHQIPLPYSTSTGNHATTGTGNDTHPVRTRPAVSHATFHLPTVQTVVRYLYGHGPMASTEHVDFHVDTRLSELSKKTLPSTDHPNLYRMNGQQIMDAELLRLNDDDSDHATTKSFVLHYQKFIHALEDPSAATIVQKLRSYLRQLLPTSITTSNRAEDADTTVETVATAMAKFQSYTHSIYDTVRNHPLFTDTGTLEFHDTSNTPNHNDPSQAILRRCYDSFVYGHCYSYFETLFNTPDVTEKSNRFRTNVQFLSTFVTPLHLDIHCLASIRMEPDHPETDRPSNDHGESGRTNDLCVTELLSKSVSMFQSIDAYYSPYEKLQRILLLYHEITVALKRASTSTTKLPSADDILPTFIYVILLQQASSSGEQQQRQNPSNLYYNLYYIEQLLTSSSYRGSDTATTSNYPGSSNSHNNNNSSSSSSNHHYLRGEAGYAYTNLYSAYQFISDFDIASIANPFHTESSAPQRPVDATPPPPPSSLSISREAWTTAIKEYKIKAQEKYDAIQKASSDTNTPPIDSYEPDLSVGQYFEDSLFFDAPALSSNVPTPMDIRQARLRGETIDLDWALRHQHLHDQRQSSRVSNQAQYSAPRTVF